MNIHNIHDCYGCGVCAIACSKKIIDIRLNCDGFYEPTITDAERCTNCGLCVDVCSFSHRELSVQNTPVASYGAWSNDHQVRRKCSSGGVGFELGRHLMGKGYKVCGVRYDVEKGRAEHYIATSIEELVQSAGSKYIQSYTADGFKAIDRKQKYLVTGTPCQMDSFRRYIRKFRCEDNFVLMDFFCHGVPSMLAWQKYCLWAETKVGKITYASWRNKFTGWHDSWAMSINGEEKCGDKVNWHDSYNMLICGKKSFLNSRWTKGDAFYGFFLSNMCLGKACYNSCKYKYDHSSADIRIGDAWGSHYKDDEDGVCVVIAFTPKGDKVLKRINCKLEELTLDVAAEGQMAEKLNEPVLLRKFTLSLLRTKWMKISQCLFVAKVARKILKMLGKHQEHKETTMKKTLLVTMFRVPNFGSVLQTYASQYVLEKLGCECRILNYDHNDCSWAKAHGVHSQNRLKYALIHLLGLKAHHRKENKLSTFIAQNLKLTKRYFDIEDIKRHEGNAYDLYVSGSDQVWNTRFTHCNPVFLLNFVNLGGNCISISSSFASKEINPKYKRDFTEGLAKFSSLSVREQNGIEILKTLGINNARVVIDPTLLLSYRQWDELRGKGENSHGKYILLYMWTYAFEPRPYIFEVLKYWQDKLKCKIVVLEGYGDMYDKSGLDVVDATDSSIPDFLSLFANASLVVTSSFHGTAFALNYGVPLISITPNDGDDRQSSLLRSVGTDSCQLKVGNPIESANPYYDKETEQKMLDRLRVDSLKWIENAIK